MTSNDIMKIQEAFFVLLICIKDDVTEIIAEHTRVRREKTLSQIDASDYIIQVTPTCPDSYSDTGVAQVTVVTDLPDTAPMALCQDDWDFYFELDNTGTYVLPAYFSGNTEDVCVFKQMPGSNVYSIDVIVPLTSSIFTFDSPMHVVVCNYDQIGIQDTGESTYGDSVSPVKEIQQQKAELSQSEISLCPANVLGRCITGRIRLGRTIMLKAELIGDYPSEVSFQALSCKAVGKADTFPILLGGCGDGIIIPKDIGFTTEGKTAKSPFFKSFRLRGSRTVTFECTFVICKTPCDGSSCESTRRRKRDTEGMLHGILLVSSAHDSDVS